MIRVIRIPVVDVIITKIRTVRSPGRAAPGAFSLARLRFVSSLRDIHKSPTRKGISVTLSMHGKKSTDARS
jgi:hypothetical protein